MVLQAQVPEVGAGFWLFLLLIVLAFGLLAVIWAAMRATFGPRSRLQDDLDLQQRIRDEKRRMRSEIDAWEESARRMDADWPQAQASEEVEPSDASGDDESQAEDDEGEAEADDDRDGPRRGG